MVVGMVSSGLFLSVVMAEDASVLELSRVVSSPSFSLLEPFDEESQSEPEALFEGCRDPRVKLPDSEEE